jgi:hypothetical protein
MGLPWWLVANAAELETARRGGGLGGVWPLALVLKRGNPRTTADNRVFTATLSNMERALCSDSADSGAGLLDGTRLPTF